MTGKIGTKLLVVCLLIIILGQFGFILYSNYYKSPSFLSDLLSKQKPTPTGSKVDEQQLKKASLAKFYKELTEAVSKDNWKKLYAAVNPSDKKWLTIEDMTLLYKKDKYSIVSTEIVVHGISVSGYKGNVDKTVIACKTKECTGENKLERRHNDEFTYIDDQWYQQAKKEPSEKARQSAAYIYTTYHSREKDRKLLADKYGGGVDDLRKIIKTIAITLENDPEFFAYTEAFVDKIKAENAKSNVYVDSPDVIQQPVVQQQPNFNNRLNCTSNSIGDYTFTNCY